MMILEACMMLRVFTALQIVSCDISGYKYIYIY